MNSYAESNRVRQAKRAPSFDAGRQTPSVVQNKFSSSLNARSAVQAQAKMGERLNGSARGTWQAKLAPFLSGRTAGAAAQRASGTMEDLEKTPAQATTQLCGNDKTMQAKTDPPRPITAPGNEWETAQAKPAAQRHHEGDDRETMQQEAAPVQRAVDAVAHRAPDTMEDLEKAPAQAATQLCGEDKTMQAKTYPPHPITAPGNEWETAQAKSAVQRHHEGDDRETMQQEAAPVQRAVDAVAQRAPNTMKDLEKAPAQAATQLCGEDKTMQAKADPPRPITAPADDWETAQAKSAVQRNHEGDDRETMQQEAATVQRAPNQTGLPDHLKMGVENLAGVSLDDTKVRYNSSRPASLKAVATTQGTEVDVAAGQEKFVPHEAWHLAQQKLGRVQPTTQVNGTPVNDDHGLEREADVMGARAESLGRSMMQSGPSAGQAAAPAQGAGLRLGQDGPVQRASLSDEGADKVETPASAIMKALDLYKNQLYLPDDKVPASPETRAKVVRASIDKNSVKKEKRKKSGLLSKITAMARAEQYIMQGADLLKFYDAGHLVADQLLRGSGIESFEMWNLAPQVSALNSPTYAYIVEEEAVAAANAGAEVEMKVSVEYPTDTYKVPLQTLMSRKMVPFTPVNSANVQIGAKVYPISKEITIPRRIPGRWRAKTKVVTGPPTDPTNKDLRATKQPAGRGKLAANFVSDISTAQPLIGLPFHFTVSDARKIGEELEIDKSGKRILEAKQWGPSDSQATAANLISWVSNAFADFDTGGAIATHLLSGDEKIVSEALFQLWDGAKNDVLKELIEIAQLRSRTELLPDDATAEIEEVWVVALAEVKKAEGATLSNLLVHLPYLINAKGLFHEVKTKIEEAKAALEEQRRLVSLASPPSLLGLSPQQDVTDQGTFTQPVPHLVPVSEPLVVPRSEVVSGGQTFSVPTDRRDRSPDRRDRDDRRSSGRDRGPSFTVPRDRPYPPYRSHRERSRDYGGGRDYNSSRYDERDERDYERNRRDDRRGPNDYGYHGYRSSSRRDYDRDRDRDRDRERRRDYRDRDDDRSGGYHY